MGHGDVFFFSASSNEPENRRDEGDAPHWNLFARMLAEMLWAHDQTPLSLLDNLHERPGEQLAPDKLNPAFPGCELVHRAKIRRLKDSLRAPGTLPILGRDDLERISRYFRLNAAERRRFSAAILATHIQLMVYERMHVIEDPQQLLQAARLALRAAVLLLPTLDEALRTVGEEVQAFRQGKSPTSATGVIAAPEEVLQGG